MRGLDIIVSTVTVLILATLHNAAGTWFNLDLDNLTEVFAIYKFFILAGVLLIVLILIVVCLCVRGIRSKLKKKKNKDVRADGGGGDAANQFDHGYRGVQYQDQAYNPGYVVYEDEGHSNYVYIDDIGATDYQTV